MAEQGFSVRLSARVDGYLAAMEAAKQATKEVGDSGVNFDRLGSKMTDVGLTLSKSVTLPLIAAGGIAVKMSSDYEASFARMEGLAGVTAGEVDGLKKSVLDLAGQTAQAPQKLADALYEASSAGLDTEGALAAVTVAAKGAAVGMGSAQDIVSLVASATASYGKENITAAKATDILTASIKAGRADPTELAGSLGRILPIASQLGISFDEVGGATAFLSNIMGNTAETVTALQGFMVQLLSPTKQGQQALQDMGTSVEELHAAIDQNGLMGALDLLRSKGFGANQEALRNLFPDVQAFQGALALVNDTSGALNGTLDATKNSTGALDTAFSLASDTAGFKMKQAWADVQVALIQAGDVILPIVSGIAGAVAHLATGFTSLPGPVQTILVAFLGLAAAAGPVLMVAGSLVKNFNLMKSTFATVSAHISDGFGLMAVAGAAALYVLNNHLNEVAKTKAFDHARIDLFVAALKDGATAAQAWDKALSDSGKLEFVDAGTFGDVKDATGALARMGITFDELKAHMTGSREEFGLWVSAQSTFGQEGSVEKTHDLNTVIQAGGQLMDQYTKAVQQNKDEIFAHGKALDGEAHGLDGVKSSVEEATAAVGDLNAALPLTDEQLKANKEATASLSDALKNSTNVFEQMAASAATLDKALREVFDPTQNLEDTQQALNKAITATTQSIKDNGTTLDINTDKGNANRDAIQAQANAAIAHGVAMVGMGASNAQATDFINFNIAALRNQLIAAGLTEDQVDSYITTLGLTPENVNTAITLADTEATKERIKGLQDQLGDIDAGAAATIEADINQGKFDEAEALLKWVARTRQVQLDLLPGTGLRLIWAAGTTPLIRFGETAMGGYFDQEQIRSFAEGGHPEAALPLDKPGRMSQLLSDPRISTPIAAAWPGTSVTTPAVAPVTNNSVNMYGDIREEVDHEAFWQRANFALAAMS